MFWLFLICRHFIVAQAIFLQKHGFLGLQFSSHSLFSSENNAFSATCDVCRKLVKLVLWSKYHENICTRFEYYLYSTEWSCINKKQYYKVQCYPW